MRSAWFSRLLLLPATMLACAQPRSPIEPLQASATAGGDEFPSATSIDLASSGPPSPDGDDATGTSGHASDDGQDDASSGLPDLPPMMRPSGPPIAVRVGVFDEESREFRFDTEIAVLAASSPLAADWSRWAMVDDDYDLRLYTASDGSNQSVLQFGLDPEARSFEYGYNSTTPLAIDDTWSFDALTSFGMVQYGYDRELRDYRLLRLLPLDGRVVQYRFDFPSLAYLGDFNTPAPAPIQALPADWSTWAAAEDADGIRLFVRSPATPALLYTYAYAPETNGFVPEAPATLDTDAAAREDWTFAATNGLRGLRLYQLER